MCHRSRARRGHRSLAMPSPSQCRTSVPNTRLTAGHRSRTGAPSPASCPRRAEARDPWRRQPGLSNQPRRTHPAPSRTPQTAPQQRWIRSGRWRCPRCRSRASTSASRQVGQSPLLLLPGTCLGRTRHRTRCRASPAATPRGATRHRWRRGGQDQRDAHDGTRDRNATPAPRRRASSTHSTILRTSQLACGGWRLGRACGHEHLRSVALIRFTRGDPPSERQSFSGAAESGGVRVAASRSDSSMMPVPSPTTAHDDERGGHAPEVSTGYVGDVSGTEMGNRRRITIMTRRRRIRFCIPGVTFACERPLDLCRSGELRSQALSTPPFRGQACSSSTRRRSSSRLRSARSP